MSSGHVCHIRRLVAVLIILLIVIALPLDAQAATSGFRVRKTNGDSLPGAVSFTPFQPAGKASSIISSIQSRSQNGKLISYFPSYAQNEIRDLLPDDCPDHAISLRGYTAFKVKGYTKSVGSVVMRVETGTQTSSSYHYIALVSLIYKDGSVDWYTYSAKIYSGGTFSVTLGASLCAALAKEGRSAVLFIIGESYRWW